MSYKIEELQLKNFGIVGDFYCDQFSNINLIIGENGTGKTFLLKAFEYTCLFGGGAIRGAAYCGTVKAMEEYKRGDDISPMNDILSEKLRWTYQVDKLGDIVSKTAEDGLDFNMKMDKTYLEYQFSKSAASKVGIVGTSSNGKEGDSIFIPA